MAATASKKNFNAGDLVFAKVKGFPPWPARITGVAPGGKYAIFFYGTYETGFVKKTEVWELSPENEEQFVAKNIHRRGYREGMEQIKNSPEIAPSDLSELMESVAAAENPDMAASVTAALNPRPAPVKKTPAAAATALATSPSPNSKAAGLASTGASSAPPVVKRPVKLWDGTPLKRDKQAAPSAATAAATPGTPAGDGGGAKRRASKRSLEDDTAAGNKPEDIPDSPAVSRSGRVIKQKKFPTDGPAGGAVGGGGDGATSAATTPAQPRSNVDSQIEDPRKIWVKMKGSGDLIEINLDKDKPERWESHEQKLQWELATARNAVKFKRGVECGRFLPSEVEAKIREKVELSPQDKEIIRQEALIAKRKKKIAWLLIEQEMVDTELAIKSSLKAENPQTEKCLQLLNSFTNLKLEKLMLLKQPETLLTIRKLRKYVGPSDLSAYSDKDRERLKKHIGLIQTKGDLIYKKIKAMFQFKESPTNLFPDYLAAMVADFRAATAGMDEVKVLSLTEYPVGGSDGGASSKDADD